MLAGPLRAVSLVASAVVVLSFVLFALDETRAASERSAAETAGLEATRSVDPSPNAERARAWDATAVGGLTMGADAPACAALAGGADVKAFFVRKDVKAHGLQRRIEGPLLEPQDRCLIVEDVVTTGGSTLQAIEAVREAGHEIVGVVAILDRLAGGADAIREAVAAPYEALATIDDVYPDRPDREQS